MSKDITLLIIHSWALWHPQFLNPSSFQEFHGHINIATSQVFTNSFSQPINALGRCNTTREIVQNTAEFEVLATIVRRKGGEVTYI